MTITAKGYLGAQITFDGRTVEIARKGLAALSGGSGSKRIPVRAITAVQLKPAGVLTNGFIQFTIAGGNEVRAQWGRQTFDAAGDENSVIFRRKDTAQFEELRAAVEDAISALV